MRSHILATVVGTETSSVVSSSNAAPSLQLSTHCFPAAKTAHCPILQQHVSSLAALSVGAVCIGPAANRHG